MVSDVNYTYIGRRNVYTQLITRRSLERENGGGGKIPYGIILQFHSPNCRSELSFKHNLCPLILYCDQGICLKFYYTLFTVRLVYSLRHFVYAKPVLWSRGYN